jgi:RNA polymerase sigma factor (sigma-70 family)
MTRLLDYLRRVLEEPLGDADLLERFIEKRDETAFAVLLKRHGPMVFGVCQRILGNPHDAEDAFQATFLILARRVSSVRPREAVGNWLYGVAYRTALEARAKIKRRCAREKQVDEMPEPEERRQECRHDLLALLDRELHRLPDKYRLPVVLCDLEGRSRKEVARQLAIPEGTLSSRLAAARKKLVWRLSRYGLSVSGASLALLMTEKAVPASLLVATLRAAMLLTAGQVAGISAGVITLTEGVLRTMFIAKLKTATVFMSGVAALGLGTGGLMYQTHVGAADSPRPGQSRVANQQEANSDDEASQREKDRAKRAAEEELRAREEVEKARREAEMQRERAEAERRRAEEALRELREQLTKAQEAERRARRQATERRAEAQETERRARQQAEAQETERRARHQAEAQETERRARHQAEAQEAEARAQAQEAERRARQQEENIRKVRPDEPRLSKVRPDEPRLSGAEARVREEFERQRQSLKEQLKKLEVEEQVTLRKLAAERIRSLPPKQQSGDRESPSGDKLDRILERLERMERRLERLERGGGR